MFEPVQRVKRWITGSEATQMTDGGKEPVVTEPAADGPNSGPQTLDAPDVADDTPTDTVVNTTSAELLDLLAQPTFILDTAGRIVAWNDAIEELTGASSAEAIGHEHASEMFYPDGRRA